MKTPRDLLDEDVAVALGTDLRSKRADQVAPAKGDRRCSNVRTHNECCDVQALALIESALSRLATGTYGICLSCNKEISLKRLDLNPAAETCASCDAGPVFKAN